MDHIIYKDYTANRCSFMYCNLAAGGKFSGLPDGDRCRSSRRTLPGKRAMAVRPAEDSRRGLSYVQCLPFAEGRRLANFEEANFFTSRFLTLLFAGLRADRLLAG